MDTKKIIQAGQIASQIHEWIKPQIKKGTSLLEIAEKIESKMIELGGKPAFPTNLSINEIAAHYTPSYDDKTPASGLLKVDFGVHVDGWISDTAFSVDLENSAENKKLIEASEKALDDALKTIKENIRTEEIGKKIQSAIESSGFKPIINLTGHQIEQYSLHAGLAIPNTGEGVRDVIKKGLYAIEPFATTGSGKVFDGKPSGIYSLIQIKNARNPLAREIFDYILKEYDELPFCSRWLVKKFGTKSLIALKQLEENGNLHQYPQLIEVNRGKVSQSEHTVLVEKDEVKVTTRN